MIKTYCDICGMEIKDSNESIEINFAIPLSPAEAYESDNEYQFMQKHVCTDCKSKFLNTFREEESKPTVLQKIKAREKKIRKEWEGKDE